MWRLIKWLFFLALISGIALWVTGYKVRGKTIQEHIKPYTESKSMKEGIRDIRQLVGEGLKAAGEAVSEDVTDSERKQLEDVLKKELMKGKPIESAPGQISLPPQQNTNAQAPVTAPAQLKTQTAPAAPQTQPQR